MDKKALVLSIVSFYTFLIITLMPVFAQEREIPTENDMVAPVIQHRPPSQQAVSGMPFRIDAEITDNQAVGDGALLPDQGQDRLQKPFNANFRRRFVFR